MTTTDMRERVLALHRPSVQHPGTCYECSLLADPVRVPYPCVTASAVLGEQDGDAPRSFATRAEPADATTVTELPPTYSIPGRNVHAIRWTGGSRRQPGNLAAVLAFIGPGGCVNSFGNPVIPTGAALLQEVEPMEWIVRAQRGDLFKVGPHAFAVLTGEVA